MKDDDKITTKELSEKNDKMEFIGNSFIKLGEALKNENTNIKDLCNLAYKCGLDFQFRFTKVE